MNDKKKSTRTGLLNGSWGLLLAQVVWLLAHASNPVFAQNPSLAATATPVDEVYRIVIVKDVGDKEGRDTHLMLETLGYIPVHLMGDFGSGKGTVLLGNFPTQKEAQKIKEQLIRDGFMPFDIVKSPRNLMSDGQHTILVEWFDDVTVAESNWRHLSAAGMLNVNLLRDMKTGRYFVTAGWFTSTGQASLALASLKDTHGCANARIVDAKPQQEVVLLDQGSVIYIQPLTTAEIKAATGKSVLEKDLSEIEILLNHKCELTQRHEKQSDPTLLQQEYGKIDQRLQQLGGEVGGILNQIVELHEQRRVEAERRLRIEALIRDASDLARTRSNEAVLVRIREILEMDAENALAMRREQILNNMIQVCPISEEDIQREYELLKQQAITSAKRGTIPDLVVAKTTWAQIKVLHDRYKPEAESRMKVLAKRIEKLEEKNSRDQKWGFFGF